MRTTLENNGLLRCTCGTLVRVSDGQGECVVCGLSAAQIMEARKRKCALLSCGKEFLPEHSAQRTCCPSHGREYEMQEQTRRRHARRTIELAKKQQRAAKDRERYSARAEERAKSAYRARMSLRAMGRGPVQDPFAGEAAQGVPWAHVWAGLDPLPAGDFPERFRPTADRAA